MNIPVLSWLVFIRPLPSKKIKDKIYNKNIRNGCEICAVPYPINNGNIAIYLGLSLIRNIHLVNIHLERLQVVVLSHP